MRLPPLLAVLTLGVAITMSAAAHTRLQRSAAELMDVLMWNRESIGGPFTLIDHQGHKRTDKDFRGKLLLVYFGYTACPDVCPTDLQQIGQAISALGARGDAAQPLFITLDPARDTTSRLAAYVTGFHPRMVGLGGSESDIHRAADAYRVYFKKVLVKPGEFAIDHAAFTYLMDRSGQYLGYFPPGTSAARMVEVIAPLL